jgi:type III pantothenate kinase
MDNAKLSESLQSAGFQVRFARVAEEQHGLICGYRVPGQLGIDRWLAMLACWVKLERSFVLVSAGTALTVDLVFNTGKHGGGYIAAGLGLGRSALLSRSEKLRGQYGAGPAELSPGRDTSSAIDNGTLLAAVGLVRGVKSLAGMGQAELVISGGDAPALVPHFPGAILWENIVLDGLQVWAEVADREN